MAKKGKKGSKSSSEKKQSCLSCGGEVVDGATFCSPTCEVTHLKRQIAEKDEKLARLSNRKGPVSCLGRVDWSTCCQEWYTKASYDAKRRTIELRKLGFECSAHVVGEMPVEKDDAIVMTKMTIVTCNYHEENGDVKMPPNPPFVNGLGRDSACNGSLAVEE